ncbi:CheR family methyltransferase [Terriglobus tenax]|uniref:CheR family methyltransferase n=1 Tax=Terriglobus tenax TaxID=1111115 RepID=UPI0021E0C8C2|nr:protein-glutamate O-methyltransferase CheR [Terriglobus tenax]
MSAFTSVGDLKLSSKDFDRFRKLAYDYCGLAIDTGKESLVASRLTKIMRSLNITSFSDYYDYVVRDSSSDALVAMIDGLTTNYTNFFREPKHFEFLTATIFPALASRSEFTLWSAACSSGEEPYSLAFAAQEFYGNGGPRVSLLATDISTKVLARAQDGTYNEKCFTQVPTEMLRKYLQRGIGPASGNYRVKQFIRETITFRRLNLIKPFENFVGSYPLILCRNAMIYFDIPTQQDLVDRFHERLEPGGYLFVGHAESLNNLKHKFEYVQPAVYKKAGSLKKR